MFKKYPYPVIDLLKRMLCLNPKKRITAREILLHPFMNDSHPQNANIQTHNSSFSKFDTNSNIETFNEPMTHLGAYSNRVSNTYQNRTNRHKPLHKQPYQLAHSKHSEYFEKPSREPLQPNHSSILNHQYKPLRGILKNKYLRVPGNDDFNIHKVLSSKNIPQKKMNERRSLYYEKDQFVEKHQKDYQTNHQTDIHYDDSKKLKQSVKSVYISGIKDNYMSDEWLQESIFPETPTQLSHPLRYSFKTETGSHIYKKVNKKRTPNYEEFQERVTNKFPQRKQQPTLLEMKNNFENSKYTREMNNNMSHLKSISLHKKESKNFDNNFGER